jgi:AraC-like DNA-binding protein
MPSFYTAAYIAEIELSINKVQDERLFLDHEFKLEHISNMSGIPLHHLAFFFSNIHKSSFSEWRNNLRVRHSLQLITEGSLKKHSFEGIASQCGFSSRHTFIRAFKMNLQVERVDLICHPFYSISFVFASIVQVFTPHC